MLSRRATTHPLTRLLLATIACCAAGCQISLPYTPRPSPRIQIVERRLAKDGQLHDFNRLGALVQGNPAAEREARAYASAATTSTVLSAIGLVTDLGGLGVIVGGVGAKDTGAVTAGTAIALMGADFLLFSNIASNSARDHVTNAVNLYNDGLPPEALAPRAPWVVPPLPAAVGPAPVPVTAP